MAGQGARVAALDLNEEGLFATSEGQAGIRNFPLDVTDTRGVTAGMTNVLHPSDPTADNHAHVDPYATSLDLGEVDTSVDFGYEATTPYSISGTVFEDAGTSKGAFNPPPGGDDAFVAGAVVSLGGVSASAISSLDEPHPATTATMRARASAGRIRSMAGR